MHPARKIAAIDWPHDEMHVIRHQARGKYRQLQSRLGARDQSEELLVIRLLVKDARLFVGAIEDVIARPPTMARAVRGMRGK